MVERWSHPSTGTEDVLEAIQRRRSRSCPPPSALDKGMESEELPKYDISSLELYWGGQKLNAEVAKKVKPVLGATITKLGMAEGMLSGPERDRGSPS